MHYPIADIEVLNPQSADTPNEPAPRISEETKTGKARKLYIESYGCQMNFSDSEIVTAILSDNGFDTTNDAQSADLVLLNTCAIRDNAEQKIRYRLNHLNSIKNKKPGMLIGVLGCMAERLKSKLLDEEKMVDMVVGPDAYRDLPRLVEQAEDGYKAVNVFLSREETYAEITPVRLNTNGVSAFVSIMRGCDNMCSFCVVPFTRGRERSRDPQSIVAEAQDLFNKGYREVTLLGQNVDSYKWRGENEDESLVNFAQLLEKVALISPLLRIRFSTSHPKDMTDEVLHTMKKYDNICNYIHLPVQAGNSQVLERMNRTYTREWYLDRVAAIKSIIGEDCGISTDIITGFCGETEDEFVETLSIMELSRFDYAYMFAYSERPGTPAAKKYADDISEEVKKRRLNEVIQLQSKLSLERNQMRVGKTYSVLVEGPSKRNPEEWCGRTSENNMVVFPRQGVEKASYVEVTITGCTGATLFGKLTA